MNNIISRCSSLFSFYLSSACPRQRHLFFPFIPTSPQRFFSLLCPVTTGGQLGPEVPAPLCQRGIGADVQETDQAGEGQRGHEGGAGQVPVAVRGRRRLAHRGGGEEINVKEIKMLQLLELFFFLTRIKKIVR